ncbi:MAG TPA: glycosyltransferase, partial [Desulfomonilia bacterium]|nr:glycosyltransferase [Desulfomonilia bacterium]
MADGHGRPIRVLHLISTLDVGGAEKNLLNLLQAMPRDSFAHEVICMTAPGIVGDRIEEAGIHVHSLRMRKGTPDIRAPLKLRSLERRFRPQVVQCWMYHANLLGLILGNPQRILWNIRCSDMDLSLYGP